MRYAEGRKGIVHCTKVVSLSDVKQQVQDKIGALFDQQLLIYAGRPLEDDRLLSDGNIGPGETLHMVLRSFPIHVKYLSGFTITINVDPSDTISKVKEKICDIQNLPVRQQRCLIFDAQELQDNLTLQHYGVRKNATLHLILRLHGDSLSTASETVDEKKDISMV